MPLTRDVVALQQELADFLKSSKVKVKIGARPDFDAEEAHRLYDIMLRATTSARQTDAEFDANVVARDALDPEDDSKWARMLRGMTLSHRDWTVLNEARHRIRWKWHEFFQNCDLMLTPATVMTAIPHTDTPPYERTIPVDGVMRPFMNQIGCPAIPTSPICRRRSPPSVLRATACRWGFRSSTAIGVRVNTSSRNWKNAIAGSNRRRTGIASHAVRPLQPAGISVPASPGFP